MLFVRKIIEVICLFLLIGMSGFFLFISLDYFSPLPALEKNKKFSQLVVDREGKPLRAFADEKGVWRYPTEVSKVSPNYIDALINYEDRMFWHHGGVNPFSLLRAVGQLVINGKAVSGGSTISMQVARITEPHSKTIGGKLFQMFRAFQLEYHFDKEQILNFYLNYAPFGGPIEGIEAATYTYLGKSAKDLTDAEAALMAVLPQSPSRFRPDRYPVRAQKARDKVLDRLLDFDVWANNEVEQAKQELVTAEFNSRPMIAPLLSRRMINQYPNQQLIKTNIDTALQQQVAELIKNYISQFSDSSSASALVVDNRSMDVLAYVGAGDFANPHRFGHVDMVQAIRSPGSTLKPFIYAMAMDKELIHSESLLQDVPLHFGHYAPQNFTRNFSGPVSVSQALQQSLNIPSVQVLNHLGAANFSGQIENAGVDLFYRNKNKPTLSLALGGAGIRLEDLVVLYRALVAGGQTGQLRFLQEDKLIEKYLISKESAWIVSEVLSQIPLEADKLRHVRRAITQQSNRWVAHKTGTSYGHRDALVLVSTLNYTLAVWIGKPDGTPSPGEFGRKTAAPLANKILQLLPRSYNIRKQPPKVMTQEICWPLGGIDSSNRKTECLKKKNAWLIDGVAPKSLSIDVGSYHMPLEVFIEPESGKRVYTSCYSEEKKTKTVPLWPARLELWLPKKWQYQSLVPELHSQCQDKLDSNESLLIVGIEEGSKISTPPNQKSNLDLSLSVASGKGKISWLNKGKFVGEKSGTW